MNRQKRVIAINDISCVGRCSLTVALPVLSAAGLETSVLPTAVLSTHTGEFSGYTYRDLSSDIPDVVAHWQTLDLPADAIYTGYLASEAQIDLVLDAVERLRMPDTLVLVDPVMGDGGKLYAKFGGSYPDAIKRLCARADILVPNATEAALLLGKDVQNGVPCGEELKDYARDLTALGASCCVITGYAPDGTHLGALGYDTHAKRFFTSVSDRIPGFYYGTGDLLASAFLGGVLNGLSYGAALDEAVAYTEESILRTVAEGRDVRYGVNFEAGLADYGKRVQG